MKKDKKKLLGKRIREIRKRKLINQEKLAELIGVEPASISNIENGKNYPSMSNLEMILNVLDASFLDVFDFEHKKESKDLTAEINEIMKKYPEKVEDFYKILKALTK